MELREIKKLCLIPEHAKNNLVRKLRPPPGRTDHKYLAEGIKVHLSNRSKLRFEIDISTKLLELATVSKNKTLIAYVLISCCKETN